MAWTPTPAWVVRGGYGIVYDRIGAGLATTFDNGGSFGLSNDLDSPFGGFGERSPSVRFTNETTVPATYPAAPPAGFPATPEVGAGVITISIDDTLKTPYSHAFNVVVGRELGKNFGVEAAYVGRRGRNLLVRRDMVDAAQPDRPGLGRRLLHGGASAHRRLQRGGRRRLGDRADPVLGEPLPRRGRRRPDGHAGDGGSRSATTAPTTSRRSGSRISSATRRAAASARSRSSPSSTTRSRRRARSRGRSTTPCSSRCGAGTATATSSTSTTRCARGKDHASEVERGSALRQLRVGRLLRASSSTRSSRTSTTPTRTSTCGTRSTSNSLAELPFGQGSKFGERRGHVHQRAHRRLAVAGIVRWTSGFPFNVINCRSCWATNWNLQGNAALAQPGVLPELQTTRNAVGGQPSPFANRDGSASTRSATSTRARPASATCCAATATSRST